MKWWLFAACVAAAGCGPPVEPAQPMQPMQHDHAMAAASSLHHAISCGPAEQDAFDRGLAYLHDMEYARARKAFGEAAAAHPQCAMLFWGTAMTYFSPVWSGQPTAEALKNGADAVGRAQQAATASPIEREYVAAVAAYYADWEHTDHAARLQHWAAAQQQLAAHAPDDIDAQAFAALSQLATLDKRDKQKSGAARIAIAEHLEALLQQHPHHPGLMHYLVHAYDNPALAPRGVDIARQYAQSSPDAAHALHMPSHIFVRLGDWKGVIDSNVQSAAAALRHPPKPGYVSRDFLHATDYLVYAYLQVGDDDRAKEALSKIDPTAQYERSNGPASYALAASAARFAIERNAWRDAAALVPRAVPYDWEHYPWSEAVTYAARGLGSARTGDVAGAQAALAELERLEPLVQSAWWKGRVHIDHDVVLGWTDYVRGDAAHAEQVMRAAAAREVETGKDSVEPGHVISAVEQLGDLLLELKRPGEALDEFKTALAESPHRFAGVYGAALAAEQAGNTADAKRFYTELTSIAGGSKRPEVAHARDYLRTHP